MEGRDKRLGKVKVPSSPTERKGNIVANHTSYTTDGVILPMRRTRMEHWISLYLSFLLYGLDLKIVREDGGWEEVVLLESLHQLRVILA